jgi:hypothetical protein
MKRASKTSNRLRGGLAGAALAASLLVASSVAADGDSCREWRLEHRGWKTEALRRYLRGAPEREVDAAVFELLQREAYLTSCEISIERGRDELVGWRLAERTPEEYGSAVAESVLGRAGFDLSLRSLFEVTPSAVAAAPSRRSSKRWNRRGVGPR